MWYSFINGLCDHNIWPPTKVTSRISDHTEGVLLYQLSRRWTSSRSVDTRIVVVIVVDCWFRLVCFLVVASPCSLQTTPRRRHCYHGSLDTSPTPGYHGDTGPTRGYHGSRSLDTVASKLQRQHRVIRRGVLKRQSAIASSNDEISMTRSDHVVTNGNQAAVANNKQCVSSSSVATALTHSNTNGGAQALETTDVTNGNQKTLRKTVTTGDRDDAITVSPEDSNAAAESKTSNTNTNNNQEVLTSVTHDNMNVVGIETTGQCLWDPECILTLSFSSSCSSSEGKNRRDTERIITDVFGSLVCDKMMHWHKWERNVPSIVYSSQN